MIKLETKSGCLIRQVHKGRSNVYLISRNRSHILVDSGFKTERKSLIAGVKKLGIGSLDLLVLTHAHHDHAGNAAAVKETFGCRVLVHQQGEDFLVRGRSPMVRATGPISKLMMACFGRFVLPKLKYPPCIPDIVAEERYDFKADGLDIAVIHTPGHTACSLSVIVDGEVALVGDTLFGVFKKSVMPPFANDTVQLKESWRKLLDSGCSVFLPGHGKPVAADRIRAQLN